jgi:hypothetical protein
VRGGADKDSRVGGGGGGRERATVDRRRTHYLDRGRQVGDGQGRRGGGWGGRWRAPR